MRREALLRARAVGIRVWLALVILAPGVSQVVLAPEPVREALKDSEWFDYERDDYRRYNPEDIEIPEDDWRCRQPERDLALPDGGAVAFFLNGLVYLVLAAVVALIFYLLYRVIQERRDAGLSPEDLAATLAGSIEHAELPPDFAAQAGVRERLNLKRLRELIEAAFASADLNAAAIYLYLFALLRLSAAGRLELKNEFTARDYARQLAAESNESLPFEFSIIARNFEFALYGGRLPGDANEAGLREIWRNLDGAVGAGSPHNENQAVARANSGTSDSEGDA